MRNRNALPMTDTELKLIAALAMIGLSSKLNTRVEHARRYWDAKRVVDESEDKHSVA